MSTKGLIIRNINNNDEKCYEAIYSHFDSYLSNVGQLLLDNYSTKEKLDELFEKDCDIRSLEETVDKTEFYENDEKVLRDLCTVNDIEDHLNGMGYDYLYLFEDNKWHYVDLSDRECSNFTKELRYLTQAEIDEE